VWEDLLVDFVLFKGSLIDLEAKAPKPRSDVHERALLRLITSSLALKVLSRAASERSVELGGKKTAATVVERELLILAV
jgi:hypothetical protein